MQHPVDQERSFATPPRVLIVDDNPANLIALSAVLKPLGTDVVETSTGPAAIAEVARREFAVALVDVQMPEMDGFELASRLRAMDGGRELPIIFLTAIHRDARFVKKGYAAGGADYITKPFDAEVVRARVKAFVDLFEQREAVRREQVALRTEERDDAIKKLVAFERIATAALVTTELSVFLRELCAIFIDAAEAADSVTLFIRDGDRLRQEAGFGTNEEVDERLELQIGEGFAGKVAETGVAYEIREAWSSTEVKSMWLRERGTDALYGVPLVHDSDVVGVAYVGSRAASAFPEHEKRLFRALAQRAGMAIGHHVERTRLLELERRARIAAEEASRIRDEFLAVVSHELRNPLNAILGWTMSARSKAPPEIDRALAIVERNARAQARIVEDVLDVTRVGTGKLRLVFADTCVAAVVDRALEELRPTADAKRIEVVATVDPRATVHADAQRLQQVVGNLVGNAVKFSTAGGRVDLTVCLDAARVVITVVDRGDGIRPEFLPHVFEAFRQADSSNARRHSGLGLGLAIVAQLVRAHGGAITASSEGVGLGATFTVTLPAARPEPLQESRADGARGDGDARGRPPNAAVRLDGLRLLVVDDDDDARGLLENVLREHGAEVAGAGSADEGLEAFCTKHPDLVISDIAMPGRDGYDLIQDVRALPPEAGGQTPAIAVTAQARESDANRAFAAGFQSYFSKPTDFEQLVSRVAQLCGRREQGRATGEPA